MSSQVRSQELRIDVAPAAPASVTVTTTPDPRRDQRLEAFWEMVHRLIFDENKTLPHKAAVFRRYAKNLERRREADLSDIAARLAGSYDDVNGSTTHW